MTQDFWSKKYQNKQTGWDVGYPIPALTNYIDQLKNKSLKILIPGCGNGYEAAYLHKEGFTNVYIADITEEPLINFKNQNPTFPKNHILHIDFFNLQLKFDLILEHTFFCALPPTKRTEYVNKMHHLLNPEATLAGLLFSFPLSEEGPPFGGNKELYVSYLSPLFNIKTMELCYNSIKPRTGRELFFIAKTKK